MPETKDARDSPLNGTVHAISFMRGAQVMRKNKEDIGNRESDLGRRPITALDVLA